jgi:hypothetical protein
MRLASFGIGIRLTASPAVAFAIARMPRWYRPGKGRPYFAELSDGHAHLLGDPTTLIQGERVTHLVFPVRKE